MAEQVRRNRFFAFSFSSATLWSAALWGMFVVLVGWAAAACGGSATEFTLAANCNMTGTATGNSISTSSQASGEARESDDVDEEDHADEADESDESDGSDDDAAVSERVELVDGFVVADVPADWQVDSAADEFILIDEFGPVEDLALVDDDVQRLAYF